MNDIFDQNTRKFYFNAAKRIIVKLGSNVIAEKNGLNIELIRSITRQICFLMEEKGVEIIIVSSGAMASGLKKMGLKKRPDETQKRQAIAAIGQAGLMFEYENAFGLYNKKVAQILLTGDGLSDRKRYLNARNTLHTLLSWKVIPIINENDTVAVKSIQFGDNDNLSALITLIMDADMLINLTDIDGLFNKNPKINSDAVMMRKVKTIRKDIENCASEVPGELGSGGMTSKINAAKKVTSAGIPMIIANGKKENILTQLFSGEDIGTFFIPCEKTIKNRKRWIGYSIKPEGEIVIDDGASKAILERGKSLLPSGIIEVRKIFSKGSPVKIINKNKQIIGIGLVNYDSGEIIKIKGVNSSQIKNILGDKPYDEVIHRDNLTITKNE
jgi:glutamate 5-kinase